MKFKNLVKISLLFVALNFQACSYVNTEKIGRVLSTDYYELDTTPKDSTLYLCEENKEFYLREIPGVDEFLQIVTLFEANSMLDNIHNIE
ncbi:MAG: hypothetical protein EBW59_03920 [Betaproteobacteria bacterium]|nr:hypothetical protein [Betaproteobacteria bacterium]